MKLFLWPRNKTARPPCPTRVMLPAETFKYEKPSFIPSPGKAERRSNFENL